MSDGENRTAWLLAGLGVGIGAVLLFGAFRRGGVWGGPKTGFIVDRSGGWQRAASYGLDYSPDRILGRPHQDPFSGIGGYGGGVWANRNPRIRPSAGFGPTLPRSYGGRYRR
jgi:hypothetical protein